MRYRTSAPLAMSSGDEYSLGEWLIPSFAGYEDHAHRRDLGDVLRILAGKAGQVDAGEPNGLCRVLNRSLYRGSRARGFHIVGRLATRIHAFFLVGLPEALREVLPHPHNFRAIKVSQFDRKFGATGNDVGSARFNLHETDVAYLRSGFAEHNVAHRKHVFGGSRKRVVSTIHRSSAGVVSAEPRDDAIPAADGNNPLHHADRNLLLV